MNLLNDLLSRFGVGRLGVNATYGSIGLGARAVIQACYLILLSRWMGAQGYGLFAGSVAAVLLVAPLSGWGVAYVLSRGVAHERSRSNGLWANALVQITVTGAILSVVVVLVASLWMPERISIVSLLLLAVAELLLLPMAQACTSLCFALDRGLSASFAICLVPLGRLLTALAFVSTGAAGESGTVALSHLLGSIVGMSGAVVLIAIIDGLPAWRQRRPIRETLSKGTSYALGALVGTSYMEVDKVFMLQMLGAAVVGPYTAAFRVASVFVLPISALASAVLPRLFASHGGSQGRATLKAMAWASLAYGFVAMLTVACISPLMPRIFGADFAGASNYLLCLAAWPLLFALHQAAATGLTGFDRQHARVAVESVGLLLAIALNAVLMQRYGANASVMALLATEAFMAGVCMVLLRAMRKQPDSS